MHTPKIDMHIYLQAKFTPLSKLKPACQQTVHYCISARQLLSAIEHTIQSVEIPLTLRHATEWFEVQRNKPINLSRQMYTCTCIWINAYIYVHSTCLCRPKHQGQHARFNVVRTISAAAQRAVKLTLSTRTTMITTSVSVPCSWKLGLLISEVFRIVAPICPCKVDESVSESAIE